MEPQPLRIHFRTQAGPGAPASDVVATLVDLGGNRRKLIVEADNLMNINLITLLGVAITLLRQSTTNRKLKTIMANQTDAAAELAGFKDQLVKANGEIQQKIADLIAAGQNTDVSPELQAAIDALAPVAQALDDVVPDAPPAA